jgi:hypothetical protein
VLYFCFATNGDAGDGGWVGWERWAPGREGREWREREREGKAERAWGDPSGPNRQQSYTLNPLDRPRRDLPITPNWATRSPPILHSYSSFLVRHIEIFPFPLPSNLNKSPLHSVSPLELFQTASSAAKSLLPLFPPISPLVSPPRTILA